MFVLWLEKVTQGHVDVIYQHWYFYLIMVRIPPRWLLFLVNFIAVSWLSSLWLKGGGNYCEKSKFLLVIADSNGKDMDYYPEDEFIMMRQRRWICRIFLIQTVKLVLAVVVLEEVIITNACQIMNLPGLTVHYGIVMYSNRQLLVLYCTEEQRWRETETAAYCLKKPRPPPLLSKVGPALMRAEKWEEQRGRRRG